MKVALVICDGGDGSASIAYYRNLEEAKRVVEEEEEYYMNEGSFDIIDVPKDWTPPCRNWSGE